MSADRWAICPVCYKGAQEKYNTLQKKADELYGVVTEQEYLAIRKQADEPFKDPKSTLREDFEIGTTEDGEFYVTYSCSCDICDFNKSFKHEADWLKGEECK